MTAATKADPLAEAVKQRAKLCDELLGIHTDNKEIFDRIEAIKTELKALAGVCGNFRETRVGIGYVSVSPESPKSFKGDFPMVNIVQWQALKPKRREKFLADGFVEIESRWSKAYYGQVTVKTF
jgi:hypothetical protein